MRSLAFAIYLILFLSGCAYRAELGVKVVVPIRCVPPFRAELIWARKNIRYMLLGEIHGTAETPSVFAELVCAAAKSGKRILVGLEFPKSARPAFQNYLESGGTPEDFSEFLVNSGWLVMAQQSPDGRTSIAMLQMLERLRILRTNGMDMTLTNFVPPTRAETQTYYEIGMANNLMDDTVAGAFDLAMVLVGNIHARKSAINLDDVSSFDPMAMHLPHESTLSLLAITNGGEAWNCRPDCGIHPVIGSSDSITPRVVVGADFRSGYDGVIAIGAVTASPPVLEVPQ